jgi:hypothetical protein
MPRTLQSYRRVQTCFGRRQESRSWARQVPSCLFDLAKAGIRSLREMTETGASSSLNARATLEPESTRLRRSEPPRFRSSIRLCRRLSVRIPPTFPDLFRGEDRAHDLERRVARNGPNSGSELTLPCGGARRTRSAPAASIAAQIIVLDLVGGIWRQIVRLLRRLSHQ